jgi:hypothetical protein
VARVMDLPAPKFKRHNTKNSYIGNFMYMSFRTCLPTACLPVGCLPAICLSIACLHTGPVSLWLVFNLPACLPTSIYVHEFQGPPLPKLYGWGGGGEREKIFNIFIKYRRRIFRSNGNASETKANESFDNGVFFDIEAKRTPSLVS